jgi:hypothetical protein
VHLDADAIDLRVRPCEFEQRFACAEADLDHARRTASEQFVEIERAWCELDSVLGPQFIERTSLRGGRSTGANHEAANRAPMFRVRLTVALLPGLRAGRKILLVVHDGCFCVRRCSNNRPAAECSGAPARTQRDS